MKKNRVLKAIMKVYLNTMIKMYDWMADKAYLKNDIETWKKWTTKSIKYIKKYQSWVYNIG